MPSGNLLSGNNGTPATIPAAGGTLVQDVRVEGEDQLTVIADLGPTATAAGDVNLTIQPFLTDLEATDHNGGPQLADAGLDLVQTTIYPGVAAYLASGHARVMVRVQVSGFDKVRIVLKNNNATTALPGRIDFYFD